jgi:hypothetical protein
MAKGGRGKGSKSSNKPVYAEAEWHEAKQHDEK